MVEVHMDLGTKKCRCSVKSPLKKALKEITVGVLALLEGMSDGDTRVKEVLLNALIDSLEEHKNMKFTAKEDAK